MNTNETFARAANVDCEIPPEVPAWFQKFLQTMRTVVSPEALKTPEETAEIIGVAKGTLAVWRCCKRYPLKYVQIGSKIRYRLADIQEFCAARTIEPGVIGKRQRGMKVKEV